MSGGFVEAEPSKYHYEDAQTYVEHEFDVNVGGTVTMLDALERATAARARPDPGEVRWVWLLWRTG
ncbi:hypothetical protein ACFZC6_08460 [Streptomyces ossamyceticus]|uniref:hypothetical protein n=1 Tax=Streptomyces ossamyceticus TaxID=249581 RepID=UPI0036EAFF10